MDAKVTWQNGLSFVGTADSGFEISLGADPSVGGDDDGFRPLELLLVGLAGCTAMDVISILKKKKQEVTAFEVWVHADRAAAHPKVFTRIIIEYEVAGRNLERVAVERAVELSETKFCSAQAMLGEVATIDSKIKICEGEVT